MNDNGRGERIERYRAASLEADALFGAGKKDESLRILNDQHAAAAQAGDEDYRAFFEAEILGCSTPDYPRQIAILCKGLDRATEKGFGGDYFLFRNLAVYLSQSDDEDRAIAWFDKALAENPKDWKAIHGKGIASWRKDDKDAAIRLFRQAHGENPSDPGIMRSLAKALDAQGQHPEAAEWYDKAAGGIEGFIKQLRTAYATEAEGYLSQKAEQEKLLRVFFKPQSRLDPQKSLLMVLPSGTPTRRRSRPRKRNAAGAAVISCGTTATAP